MPEEPEGKRCDPEDIICQMETLLKMRNLRSAFDDEKFREKYPSLVELSDKLDESIKEETADIKQRLGSCNLPAEITEEITEPEKEKETNEQNT